MKIFKPTIILFLFIFIATSGFGCKGSDKAVKEFKPVMLEYWGVWDTEEQLEYLIKDFEKSHPAIKIKYRNFNYDEYERELLEAWADDRGPDLFLIPITWLREYQRRLEPIPKIVKIPTVEVTGTIKKETITVMKEYNTTSLRDLKKRFVETVYDDVILDNKIYGMPYYLDTLVTIYNEDILTMSGIPEPIEDFHDLIDQAPKLTKVDLEGNILQSAVALGTANNIPRFFDILFSIMMLNGVNLNPFYPQDEQLEKFVQTLSFYMDFTQPGKASYSWSESLPNAFEQFINGKLAYFFGYNYHADELRRRGVQFDWGLVNFPQTRGSEGTKYYAHYWVNVVAKKSKNTQVAWSFIDATANQKVVEKYLNINKKPTALKGLIDKQLQDDDIYIFTSQVLTADNWYKGYDIKTAEKYTADLINDILSGEISLNNDIKVLEEILNVFFQRINNTYNNKYE